MTSFIQRLIRRFIPDADQITDPDVRSRYGALEGWLSIVVNTFLFLVKALIGIFINSVSLIADAIHSLSDTATSLVVIIGFRVSRKPPDVEHPYGHGRAEYIATLIISILLIVIGVEFIQTGIRRIIEPVNLKVGIWVLLAVVLTVLIKEGMAQIARSMGITIESDTLQADYWHHRTDAISSGLVLVALIGGNFGIYFLDGIAALGVAGILIYSGYDIARRAVDSLMGKPPSREFIQKIRHTAREVQNVLDAHDIVVHSYGQEKYINLHIEVDENEAPMIMHDAAEEVENRLHDRFNAHAMVHIDPIETNSEEVRRVRDKTTELSEKMDEFLGFHELRVVHTDSEHAAYMDVMLQQSLTEEKVRKVLRTIQNELDRSFPDIAFHLHLTPMHRYK